MTIKKMHILVLKPLKIKGFRGRSEKKRVGKYISKKILIKLLDRLAKWRSLLTGCSNNYHGLRTAKLGLGCAYRRRQTKGDLLFMTEEDKENLQNRKLTDSLLISCLTLCESVISKNAYFEKK